MNGKLVSGLERKTRDAINCAQGTRSATTVLKRATTATLHPLPHHAKMIQPLDRKVRNGKLVIGLERETRDALHCAQVTGSAATVLKRATTALEWIIDRLE
jgi:hypothetical protein